MAKAQMLVSELSELQQMQLQLVYEQRKLEILKEDRAQGLYRAEF